MTCIAIIGGIGSALRDHLFTSNRYNTLNEINQSILAENKIPIKKTRIPIDEAFYAKTTTKEIEANESLVKTPPDDEHLTDAVEALVETYYKHDRKLKSREEARMIVEREGTIFSVRRLNLIESNKYDLDLVRTNVNGERVTQIPASLIIANYDGEEIILGTDIQACINLLGLSDPQSNFDIWRQHEKGINPREHVIERSYDESDGAITCYTFDYAKLFKLINKS